jgi:hypothetical protein
MEGGRTANYWPGFVDALTNVVIAMVFVIVVLAIALSFAAQMMGKKMANELVRAKAEVTALRQASVGDSAAPPHEPASGGLVMHTTIQVKAAAAAAAASAVVRHSDLGLRLVFADNAIALDKDAIDQLHMALASKKSGAVGARVEVVGTGPAMGLSDNQRSAYLRVLAVRNELIDQGFAVERIDVRIDTDARPTRPTVTVSFPLASGNPS